MRIGITKSDNRLSGRVAGLYFAGADKADPVTKITEGDSSATREMVEIGSL